MQKIKIDFNNPGLPQHIITDEVLDAVIKKSRVDDEKGTHHQSE